VLGWRSCAGLKQFYADRFIFVDFRAHRSEGQAYGFRSRLYRCLGQVCGFAGASEGTAARRARPGRAAQGPL